MPTKRGTDSENLEKLPEVIKLLEADKPITKKQACEMLSIAYNTTRLQKLIDSFKEKQARAQQRRKELQGKPASSEETKYIIQEYLVERSPVDKISELTHRSTLFIRSVLQNHNVPLRRRSSNYFKPEMVPDQAVRAKFKDGEIVYSMRYDCIAEVIGDYPHPEEYVYRLWLPDPRWQQFAYQPASELASLEHLVKLGIKV